MSMKDVQQAVADRKRVESKSQDKRKIDSLQEQVLLPQTKTAQCQPETFYDDQIQSDEESIVMIEGEEDIDAEVVPVPSTTRQKAERHNARGRQLRLMRMKDIAESREMRLLRRGLYVQKPTLGAKHVMWADKKEVVRIYCYLPSSRHELIFFRNSSKIILYQILEHLN